MCFSATASFVSGTVLLAAGSVTAVRGWRGDRRYLPLAGFPALFGIQQLIEGGVWLSVEDGLSGYQEPLALGFLFFAYFLWPLLTPLAAWRVERDPSRRHVLERVVWVGGLFGAMLFLPVWAEPERLRLAIIDGSISYGPIFLLEQVMPAIVWTAIYIFVVTFPLLYSSKWRVQRFGKLVFVSVLVGGLLFEYAFTSVWCFFAGVLSLYVYRIVGNRIGAES